MAAACAGSAASTSARTATMRRAPASTTAWTFVLSMPPMANQGRAPAVAAAWRTYPRPAAARPGFVGVAHTGPTAT